MIARPDPNDVFDYGGGPSYWGASHTKQITDFYDALSEGRQPEMTGQLLLETTHQLIMGLYESGKTHQVKQF